MSMRRWGAVAVALAAAGVALPRLARSRVVRRRAEVARLGARVGARTAMNRAQRVFADADRREELSDALSLQTAEDVARTLGQMKGALMKVGQLASFVDDGMPEHVREALEQLQQSAPPMAPELAASVVEEELGARPQEIFAQWDPQPIAAASIGQVHRAMTRDGRAVAVKIQYPNVAEAIEADLANLDLATMAMPLMWKSMDAKAVADELRERLTEELDYLLEAKNQRLFADWYREHPFIHVPDVVDELSTRRVLTSELAEGVRFQELLTWDQRQKDLAGEAIYRFVFRSYYRFHAFNGDPHPGNYLFQRDGRVTFLDFGLVKHFSDDDIELSRRMAHAAVLEPDIAELRRVCEDGGYFVPGAPLSDERLAEYSLMFWEPTLERGHRPITNEWATDLVRKYMFGQAHFGDVLQYARVPKDAVFLQRINLGVFAILGRLNATTDWRGVAEELWPGVDGLPATELGEQEAAWLARRH
jgi:predicted unusual protein kinase regulating ubiquinone biosynthesis (AarF/ABC1/UbiB family)